MGAALALALAALALTAGTAFALPPTISNLQISSPTTNSVTLEAKVNPEKKATFYHFEYGTSDCSSGPCTSVPAVEPNIGSGSTSVAVEAKVEGLSPGATYHFRVVAHHSGGSDEVKSGDRAFSTYSLPPAFGPCPNAAFRGGESAPLGHPSAALPDCRAYEQASPIDKNGGDLTGSIEKTRASVGGDRISFAAYTAIPPAETGTTFTPLNLASRSADAWSTQGVAPPPSAGGEGAILGWTPDFSDVFEWARTRGEPSTTTLLAHSMDTHALTTIVPNTVNFSEPQVPGSSADGSLVFFEFQGAPLSTGSAAGKPNLYVWDRETGAVQVVGVLNTGAAPPGGSSAGSYDWVHGSKTEPPSPGGAGATYYTRDQHAISADGSSVYFTAAESGKLYLRKNPAAPQSAVTVNGSGEEECTEAAKACTIQVSASQKTNGNGTGGTELGGPLPAAFQAASADGSVAYFTSSEGLTDEANTGPEPTEAPTPPAIVRANLDGSGVEPTFIAANASALAVDAGHIYWANPETASIGRAELDGENPEPHFIAGAGNPQALAVDANRIYWADATGGTIGRANLNGSGVEPTFIAGASTPLGVAVDATHVYWTNYTKDTIGRANLDGSGVDQEFVKVPGYKGLRGIAVTASHIFYASHESGKGGNNEEIDRLELDGSNETQVQFAGTCDVFNPVTFNASHVYFLARGHRGDGCDDPSYIGRANLDGSGSIQKFITGSAVDYGQGMAVDASHLYWSTRHPQVSKAGNDLYRFDAGTGKLTDVAPDPIGNGADVKGVVGASDDGSYVYFVANAVLAEGASPGSCAGTPENVSGSCNLYLSHEGQISFVTRLDDAGNWRMRSRTGGTNNYNPKASRVSADGRTLLFRSGEKLTAYDNALVSELYRYRVGSGIVCVSCNPTGAAPTAAPGFASISPNGISSFDPAPLLSRNLSADGNRVFFETDERLVAADANGAKGQDIYEWEAPGSGSCSEASSAFTAVDDGCIYLISTGTSADASYFADASASGDDVFFFTRSQLVGQDEDQLVDVYDARVGGGLVSQNEPPPPVPCEGEACKPGSTPAPESQSPGTPSFVGPPNPKPKKAHAKKHKRKHHKRHRRRAHDNRRAQR